MDQKYTFPLDGLTQEGDEYWNHVEAKWCYCGFPIHIQLTHNTIRRPVKEPAITPSVQISLGEEKPQEEDLEPPPKGVYFSAEYHNFYMGDPGTGMGMEFYEKWKARAGEFPTSPYADVPAGARVVALKVAERLGVPLPRAAQAEKDEWIPLPTSEGWWWVKDNEGGLEVIPVTAHELTGELLLVLGPKRFHPANVKSFVGYSGPIEPPGQKGAK